VHKIKQKEKLRFFGNVEGPYKLKNKNFLVANIRIYVE